ncbi:MAG: tetratricopeptide repeat protein [Marinoscillum sp.]|uniref:tetratricopeptide repeat protein n=1 Tax=Marinoscillum sp. TaxID=2024838 RepID=UPI0032FF6DDD
MRFRLHYIILLLLVGNPLMAQDKIKMDSLYLLVNTSKEDTVKINALLEISQLYHHESYQKAMEAAKQANDIAIRSRIKEFEAKTVRAIANVYLSMGDYKNASINYFNALLYYEDIKDTLGLLAMHNNLGVIYDRLHEYDKALDEYFKAQMLLNLQKPSAEITFRLPTLHNNIANIYQTKGDTSSALQYYTSALRLAKESNNHPLQGTALNNLGKLYMVDLDRPEKAIEYLLEGLKVREAYGDKAEIAKSLVILGNYYLRLDQPDKAEPFAKKSIALSEEIGAMETTMNAYLCLSEIEEAQGKTGASLDTYKTFKAQSDSLRDMQANREITRLQLQYDFDKAEKARAEERRQARLRYITIIITLSIGLLIAILITVIIRSRARQTALLQENLSQDVEIKNKELTTNVMYLIRKNELINSVAERLLKLQPNVLPENYKEIHNIILDLQREADNDSWAEFELRFNQVHTDFYNKLHELHPDLSPADEKLCAFLRLNMSSKEIAAITQQSVKSVEVARARLRKKLNLTNTTSNLVTYLSSLH